MRNNQPVTNAETVIPEGEFIYSRTDLRGNIVELNEAFARISAYAPEEMLGQPHNLVRHPDMPEEAFADMWADLKAGRPWRGLVKNRRKDGGFYWVVANASPVRENGSIVGYQSVRGRPTRDEIRAAEEAYRRIRAGDKSIVVSHGRVVRRRPGWLKVMTSLRSQMALVGVVAALQSLILLMEHVLQIPVPDGVVLPFAVLAAAYAVYYLAWFAPRADRDLHALGDWIDRALVSGDLRTRFDLPRTDIIGAIARRMDKFMSTVQATVQGISDVAGRVDDATHEVSVGVLQVNRSASAQSEAAGSAAAAIEEVTVSIGEVAAHARDTRSAAEEAGVVSDEGARVTHHASQTIQSLADTVGQAAEQVERLGQRSQEISRIAGTIREIADQTNLLALNAAIEAARAGEQGRGFAVVADEVRKLAERTGKATQEITSMIETIQSETGEAVGAMRAGASQVAEGVGLVNAAEESLRRINEEMGRTTGMVAEISHASAEQQNAMTELARNIEQVAAMTESNVAVVGQTGALVEQLNTVVERMRKAANQYSV